MKVLLGVARHTPSYASLTRGYPYQTPIFGVIPETRQGQALPLQSFLLVGMVRPQGSHPTPTPKCIVGANLCVRPDAGGCVRPDAGGCVRPDAGGCVRPDAGGCVRPDAAPKRILGATLAVASSRWFPATTANENTRRGGIFSARQWVAEDPESSSGHNDSIVSSMEQCKWISPCGT